MNPVTKARLAVIGAQLAMRTAMRAIEAMQNADDVPVSNNARQKCAEFADACLTGGDMAADVIAALGEPS